MKAVRFAAFGQPQEVVECAEVPEPGAPGADEIVIEIEAFPINPADLLTLEGRYAVRPALPAGLGAEGLGRIRAVGPGVTGLAAGERVIHLGRDNWAQRLKVKAEQVIKVPSDLDPLQLAMLKVNPATALLMLRSYVKLGPGEWLIQSAANSAVGTSLIRLARAEGVRTVNLVRREALIEPLRRLGGDVVLADGADLAERVARASGGAPIALAIDAVAGETCLRLADCLAEGGTVVNYGLLSGRPNMLSGQHTIFKGITLAGFWLTKVLAGTPRLRLEGLYEELVARLRDGTLGVAVEATYAIEDIKAAVAHAAREGRGGKILVIPNGPVA